MTPRPRRILAVDFGDRRTGLAATDHTGSIVVPLPALRGLADQGCAHRIAAIAAERESEVIVVGVPLTTAGEIGARARRTLDFVGRLGRAAPCPVTTVDEAHTTDEAHDRLKRGGLKAAARKKIADSVAAIIILERFQQLQR